MRFQVRSISITSETWTCVQDTSLVILSRALFYFVYYCESSYFEGEGGGNYSDLGIFRLVGGVLIIEKR